MPDPEPTTAAPATPETKPAETPANTTPAQSNQTAGAQNNSATPPASAATETTPPAAQAEAKPAETTDPPDILDLAKSDEAKKTEAAEKAKTEFDAYAKAAGFENGVTDAILKKGENGEPDLKMPAAEVGAMLQALKDTGIEATKAAPMIGMVAALDNYRAEQAAAEEKTILRNLRAEAAKEFGDGLANAARDMVSGGVALFGADLWKDLSENALPLLNDKRFIRAMASYGARLRNDNGGPAPASGGAATTSGNRPFFDLDSWAKGSGG